MLESEEKLKNGNRLLAPEVCLNDRKNENRDGSSGR